MRSKDSIQELMNEYEELDTKLNLLHSQLKIEAMNYIRNHASYEDRINVKNYNDIELYYLMNSNNFKAVEIYNEIQFLVANLNSIKTKIEHDILIYGK